MKLNFRLLKCILCELLSIFLFANTVTFADSGAASVDTQGSGEEVVAYVNFGTEVESSGMTAFMGEKPDVSIVNKLGREGWSLDPKKMQENAYIYFDVDDKIAKDLDDGSSYRVEVDYFDEYKGSIVLGYDHVVSTKMSDKLSLTEVGAPKYANALKELEIVDFTGTNLWSTYSWFMENPAMDNNLGNGADFRVGVYGSSMGYSRGENPVVIGAVRLIKTGTRSLLDIKVSTDKLGNNFFEGDRVKLKTSFDNTAYFYQSNTIGEYEADIKYTVFDEYGNVYDVKTDMAEIRPSKIEEKEVTFDIDRFGLYTIQVEAMNESLGLYSRERSVFSYVRYAGDKQNYKHGIGTSAATYDSKTNIGDAELLKNAGFGLNRVHNSIWGEIHGSIKDKRNITNMTWYRQTSADSMKAYVDNGMKLLSYHDCFRDDILFGPGEEEKLPYTDAGRETYVEMVKNFLNLYGDSCQEIEIWNEWNGHIFTWKNATAEDYAELCKYAYPRIKEAYPDVTIAGMVPSNVNPRTEGEEFFEKALAAGAAEGLDVITIHSYGTGGRLSPVVDYVKRPALLSTIDLINKYGAGDKELWITETGYSSHNATDSEYEQGWYVVQSYIIYQEDNIVDRTYSFSSQDRLQGDTRTEKESNFGILEGGQPSTIEEPDVFRSAKPAYLGCANLNALLYDAEHVKILDFSDNSKGYLFRKTTENKDLLTLFSALPQDSVTVDLGTDRVTVYDFYGNSFEQVSEDGKFTFTIDDAVLYVEGNFGRCVQSDGDSVGTDKAYIESALGETQTVRINNNSGRTLTADIKLLDYSEIECEKTVEVPDGGIDFEITVGNYAAKKLEPVHITVRDGENIYFSGDVVIDEIQKVTVDADVKLGDDGKWRICASVYSERDTEESGTIEILKPEKLASRFEVTVPPHGVKETEFVLSDTYTQSDLSTQLRYVSDNAGIGSIYLDKTFNFEYMGKVDKTPVIDGDLSEWEDGWIHLDKNEDVKTYQTAFSTYHGRDDLSADVAIKWDDENFYMALDVTDDIHYATGLQPADVWKVDSVQCGLVLYPEDMLAVGNFEEFALCYLDEKPVIYRHKSQMNAEDITVIENAELAIKQEGTRTYYEFKAPWTSLIPNFRGITPGGYIYAGICINDNEGLGRKAVMLYGRGIEDTKNYTKFKKIYICN